MVQRVWSEKDLDRRSSRRLSILRHAEEVSGNVAATCCRRRLNPGHFRRLVFQRSLQREGVRSG